MTRDSGKPTHEKTKSKKGPIRRFLRWPIRILLILIALPLMYLLMALILGLIPTNSDWKQSQEGQRVYVTTNGVHTSFILPKGEGADNLLRLVPFENTTDADCPYVQLGWGDRGFYLETPEWSDLQISTALHAVFLPSSTVVHVYYWPWEPEVDENTRRVILDPKEYANLLIYIKNSFALDASHKPQRIPDAHYGRRDAFFEGKGSYHLFQTCNDWTNAGLKAAGVKTAIWSPFDKAILYQLPR